MYSLGFAATHCLEWLWSRLTRASRCGPRASASSGLTAGGKRALSTWSQLSIVIESEIRPDSRSVLSYADRLHARQASQGKSWLQTIT